MMGEDWGARDPRWRGVRTEVVELRGVPVRTLVADGPDGPLPPQLCIHGLGGQATDWIEVLAGLARYSRVVACDLPGSGETPLPPGGSARVRASVGFVAALCRRLGWRRVILHGNSMGGTIATLVAARWPELVAGLVLVAPGLPAAPAAAVRSASPAAWPVALLALPLPGRAAAFGLATRLAPPETVVDRAIRLVCGPRGLRPAVRALWVAQARRARTLGWRRRAFVQAAESLVPLVAGGRTLRRAVAAVRAPTLVVRGSADRLVGPAVVEELRRRRPDWTVVELDGCGHVPQLECPDAYLEQVGEWLAELRGGVISGA